MLIGLVEFEYELWSYGNTCVFRVLHFDWPEGDASLLEIGVYQGGFVWDFFGIDCLLRKLKH